MASYPRRADLAEMKRSDVLKASPRMFESNLLDRLSRVHWSVPVRFTANRSAQRSRSIELHGFAYWFAEPSERSISEWQELAETSFQWGRRPDRPWTASRARRSR